MQDAGGSQNLQTAKNKTMIKLPVIKLKSIGVLRNEEFKQQAKFIHPGLSKDLIIKKLPVESNIFKSNMDTTEQAKSNDHSYISSNRKVVVPITFFNNINHSSFKISPDFSLKKETAITLAPDSQQDNIEDITNASSETSSKNTKKGEEIEDTQEIIDVKKTSKCKMCKCSENSQNSTTIETTSSSPESSTTPILQRSNKKFVCHKCCTNHQEYNELKCDDLVKVGDTFPSIKDFLAYTNARGEKWMFYYMMHSSDNHLKDKRRRVTFGCCFAYVPSTKYKAKGLRKIVQYKTNCPCVLLMYQLPNGHYKVVHVCHHHDHDLSSEMLEKLPSRYKYIGSMPYNDIKNEIYDLVLLGLDKSIIQKYMEDKFGHPLKNSMINRHIQYVKNNKRTMQRHFTAEKLRSLLIKIKELNKIYDPTIETDDQEEHDTISQISSNDPIALFNELLLEIKKRKNVQELAELENIKKPKRVRNKKNHPPPPSPEKPHSKEEDKSRLETTLETIAYDEEVLESIKEMQKSVGDEVNESPWNTRFGVQSSEELFPEENYAVKVYATTDCHDNPNTIYSNDNDYNVVAMRNDTIGTEINVQYSYIDNHDNNTSYEEIVENKYEEIVDDNHEEVDVKYEEVVDVKYEEIGDNNNEEIAVSRTENQMSVIAFRKDELTNVSDGSILNEIDEGLITEYHISKNLYDHDIAKDTSKNAQEIAHSSQDEAIKLDLERQTALYVEQMKEINKHKLLKPYLTKLNDTVINKHNIDSQIVQSDVSKSIEYLSSKLSMPIMDILKNIYNGKAVLVKSSSSQFNYVPVRHRPSDPDALIGENYLEQYKNLCSEYSSTCFHLTNVVQSMSIEVNILKRKLKNMEKNILNPS